MDKFTHLDEDGKARMVDISKKVFLNEKTYRMVKDQEIQKGDVLTVAKVAGIMAAKNTSNIIPMCHPINITSVEIEFKMDDDKYIIEIFAKAMLNAKTGVEMEALTAVSVTALTIYDMCKAVQKDIEIGEIKLLRKTGGKSGDYKNESYIG